MNLAKALSGFGISKAQVEYTPLAGGKSGACVLLVTHGDGRRFVLKMIARGDDTVARRTIEVQEAARRLGAPVPRHFRTGHGGWISHGATLQEWMPGHLIEVIQRPRRASRAHSRCSMPHSPY